MEARSRAISLTGARESRWPILPCGCSLKIRIKKSQLLILISLHWLLAAATLPRARALKPGCASIGKRRQQAKRTLGFRRKRWSNFPEISSEARDPCSHKSVIQGKESGDRA